MPRDIGEKEMSPERQAAINLGRKADWIITIIIMAIAIIFIYLLLDLPVRATTYPWFITISIMVIGGVYIFNKIKTPDKWDKQYDPFVETKQGDHDTGPAYLVPNMRAVLRTFAIFIGFVLATLVMGPKFAVPTFVVIALWVNGENKLVALFSGLFFFLVIHFVFGQFMQINLPTGILFNYLR